MGLTSEQILQSLEGLINHRIESRIRYLSGQFADMDKDKTLDILDKRAELAAYSDILKNLQKWKQP